LRRRNVLGIVAPSAALPGTQNVVLFGPHVASPYLIDPVTSVDIPSSITADGARPVLTLVDQVRFKGDRHDELEAWQNGVAFSFTEPDWAL
jgi:hypothetical protein